MNWTAIPWGSLSLLGQESCERTTSAMALIGGLPREALIRSSKTSPDCKGRWQQMKAPPALISFVVPVMSLWWALAKAGTASLTLGCCRLSFTLAVCKIIPFGTKFNDLYLVLSQCILPLTQQEDCNFPVATLLPLYLIERRNSSLQRWIEQLMCQSVPVGNFLELADVSGWSLYTTENHFNCLEKPKSHTYSESDYITRKEYSEPSVFIWLKAERSVRIRSDRWAA